MTTRQDRVRAYYAFDQWERHEALLLLRLAYERGKARCRRCFFIGLVVDPIHYTLERATGNWFAWRVAPAPAPAPAPALALAHVEAHEVRR